MWDFSSRNNQNLQPVRGRPALEIGTLVHQAHAAWLLDQSKYLGDHLITFANAKVQSVREHYREQIGAWPDDSELEDLYEQVRLCYAMCVNYQARWHNPLPDGFTIVSPEQTILVPIPGTIHGCEVCAGTGGTFDAQDEWTGTCTACGGAGSVQHYLEGTLDGLLKDEAGRLYILEHKTYGQRPKLEHLQRDEQFIGYIWLVQRFAIDTTDHEGAGVPPVVAGIAYDGMWKRESPPRNSTLEDLFFRTLIVRSQIEVHHYQTELAALVNEMFEVKQRRAPLYRSIPWMGCVDCDYQRPCDALYRNEDIQYILAHDFEPRPDDKQMAGAEAQLGLHANA